MFSGISINGRGEENFDLSNTIGKREREDIKYSEEPPRKRSRQEMDLDVVKSATKSLETSVDTKVKEFQDEIENLILQKNEIVRKSSGLEVANSLFPQLCSKKDTVEIEISVNSDQATYENLLMSNFNNNKYNEVLTLYQQMSQKKIRLSEQVVNCVLTSFMSLGDKVESNEHKKGVLLFYEKNFKSKQKDMSLWLFTQIMRMYLVVGRSFDVIAMYKSALINQRKMDGKALNVVVSAYCRIKKFEEAIEIIFNSENLGFGKCFDCYTLSKLMAIHSQMGNHDKAIDTYENRIKLGFSNVELNNYILVALMHACLELKNPEKAISYYNQTTSDCPRVHYSLVEAYLELNDVERAKQIFTEWKFGPKVYTENGFPMIDSHRKTRGGAVTEILCYLDELNPTDNTKFQVVTGKGLHSIRKRELFRMRNYVSNYFLEHKRDLKGKVIVNCDDNNSGLLWFTYGPKNILGVGDVLNEDDYRMIPLWIGYSEEERARIASYLCDPNNEQVVICYLAEFLHWAHDKDNKLGSLRTNKQDLFTYLLNNKIPTELPLPSKQYMYDKSKFIRVQKESQKTSDGKIYQRRVEGEGVKYDVLLPLSLVDKGEAHYQLNKII
ncbi:MAG: tetratricopeptide repeat protein [Chlamydiota bacterium]|nr:tetratricopeptide repeat protein [Chlamydiota bacterium]